MLSRSSSALLSVFRFLLALTVIFSHADPRVSATSGLVAVECFFVISGFLITMITTGTYAGRPRDFLVNRFLRIYPLYWVCTLLALALVIAIPQVHTFNHTLVIPHYFRAIGWDIIIFYPTVFQHRPILSLAWSLGTELWFYLIIGLVTASRPRLTFWCLCASLIGAFVFIRFWHFAFYGSPVGNAYAFFLGSWCWQWKDRIQLSPHIAVITAFAAIAIVIAAFGPYMGARIVNVAFSPLIAAAFLIALYQLKVELPSSLTGFCNWLGRLSYPMFLTHFPLLALLQVEGFTRGLVLFFYCAALSTLLSATLLLVVESPIDRLRRHIRGKRSVSDETNKVFDKIAARA